MTRYAEHDERTTIQLIRQQDSDTSWLRHRGLAAELDRRLIRGATEAELAEVRGSWRGHVRHLLIEHHLLVEESPGGFWRITGASENSLPNTARPRDAADPLGDDDDYEDGLGEASPPAAETPHENARYRETARALAALAKDDLLRSELLKASVSMLIRQASESQHWHNCAHYRSHAAAEAIPAAATVSAAKYQAFCRKNLRHEHVVPNSVIYRMLCATNDTSVEGIETLLRKYCIRATITLEEDRALSDAGLASSMPEGFSYNDGAQNDNDPMARYNAIGLRQKLVERQPNRLWHEVPPGAA